MVSDLLNKALRHHDVGGFAQAELLYRQILSAEPEQPVALYMLGILAQQIYTLGNAFKDEGQPVQAAGCYRQTLSIKPDHVEARSNLGNVLKEQGLLAEAIGAYRQALAVNPEYAQAHNNLGVALKEKGQLDEAAACYRQALRINPDLANAQYNLGNVLDQQKHFADAASCFRQALRLEPRHGDAHNNLGLLLEKEGQLDEAAACYQRALHINPGWAAVHCNLGNALFAQGQLAQAIACYRQALTLDPDYASAHANLLYALVFSPDYDAAAIHAEHRRWARRFAEPLAGSIIPHANERSAGRRLRIGYVSPNFKLQAEIFFLIPLLAGHDHANFEVFCYADVPYPDALTARVRKLADAWRDISGRGDAEVAELIRQDQIDVLVDLTMHMADNRLLVFARRPAPVQLCWLAYQGTTGLDTMDYRLSDAHVDPPGLFDRYYSEKSIRLPDAFGCYDPLSAEVPSTPLPALEKGAITFGSLNNFWKINPPLVHLWACVLKAVESSRMTILACEGSRRQQLLDLFEREGVARSRIELVGKSPRPRYLERYRDFDIALDTLPYNGQTTSLDALWMGVPVVTMAGQTAVGRAGLSLLFNVGLPELVAQTTEQFVAIAVELASDIKRLGELRLTLRQRLKNSPLMDAPRFARNMEAAYRKMWHDWCLR